MLQEATEKGLKFCTDCIYSGQETGDMYLPFPCYHPELVNLDFVSKNVKPEDCYAMNGDGLCAYHEDGTNS